MSSHLGEASKKRGRGRPPTYVFNSDEQLSESMEKLKQAIEKRRKSQKEKYHRKKQEKKNNEAKKRNGSSSRNNHENQPVLNGGLILDMAIAGTSPVSNSSRYRQVYPRIWSHVDL